MIKCMSRAGHKKAPRVDKDPVEGEWLISWEPEVAENWTLKKTSILAAGTMVYSLGNQ